MTNELFIEKCKEEVKKYYDSITLSVELEDVFIVWSCKTIQNYKAILVARFPDNVIFEITYNGDVHEMYVDRYRKESKTTIICK